MQTFIYIYVKKIKKIMAQTLFKYAILSKRNKRIIIRVYQLENGEMLIVQQTKRLVDFKSRQIITTDIVIGLETFSALLGIYNMLMDDANFKKVANRELGQVMKDKFECVTNIKTK